MKIEDNSCNQRKAVRRYFDQHFAKWQNIYGSEDNFEARNIQVRQEKVINMVDEGLEINGSKILDVGCGAGLTVLRLLRRGYFVCGVDLSPNMIEKAREIIIENNYESSCELLSGDIESLPYPNEYFDAIVCMGVLTYLVNDEKAIKEIYRVLKPKGIFVIAVSNKTKIASLLDFPSVLKNIFYSYVSSSKAPKKPFRHNKYISWKFNKRLAELGLKVQDYTSVGFGPFTFNQKKLFSFATSVKISGKLEDMSARRFLRPLRLIGQQYLVKVQKC